MPEPGEPRELRSLVPLEVAAIVIVAVAPLPEVMPVALPLVVIATASRWLRRRSWDQLLQSRRGTAAVGFAAGVAALVIALVAGTPFVEAMSGRAVEWSAFPIVRGNVSQGVLVSLIVVAMAVATELALRGWVVERVLELSPGPAILPVLIGAIAEGVVTRGDFAVRVGAALFGLGLGWMYVAAGRSLVAPICARVGFALGAVALEGLRVIG